MASRPIFSSEFCLTPQTATFSVLVGRTGGITPPIPFTMTIPRDRYFIGGSPDSRNLVAQLITELNALPGLGPFQFNILAATDNLGLSCSLSYDDSSIPASLVSLRFSGLNSVARDMFWALGFRNLGSDLIFTVVADNATVLTDGIQRYAWYPKAFAINQDDYSTVEQQVYTSGLAGGGSLVSAVRQDDGVVRWWRSWRMTQVAAARCSYPKATSTYTPQWATIAGLTTNPGDAALDREDGWWQRTCSGQYRFVVIEDELDASTPNWDVYRVVYDNDAPVSMTGWKNLRSPNVEVYSTAGATRTVQLCGIASRVGAI